MSLKLPCEITEIQNHGEGVYSVFLKPAQQAPPFRPGQFLQLALDPYEPGDFWPDSRPFSIASPASQRSLLRLTYAVKGTFTSRMKAELHTGREVWVNMPYGEFAVSMGEACLLAGGTGITAFSAFLAELPADYPCNVHIFYGARQPDLLIFRSVIQEASERCPRLLARYFVERNAGKDLFKGRPDPELVFSILPDPLALTYYLAGPPEMLADLVNGLTMLGVCDQSIRVDAWE